MKDGKSVLALPIIVGHIIVGMWQKYRMTLIPLLAKSRKPVNLSVVQLKAHLWAIPIALQHAWLLRRAKDVIKLRGAWAFTDLQKRLARS